MASKYKIKKVAVIGAGVMGREIAGVIAYAGIPVYLLDIVPPNLTDEEKNDPKARNRFALNAIDGILKEKKIPPKYSKDDIAFITPGNMEDDIEKLGEVDWIVEVVPEDPKIKAATFENIEKHIKEHTIVTSNTSGIPISVMTEGRSDTFKKNFMVTHFFNPVRYMKLLEVVVGPETDPELTAYMKEFGTNVLGKGLVFGKDTPNFVANRIGVYGMMATIWAMIDEGMRVDEVDAIVGKPMGRPASAAFGTADLVGIDTLVHVVDNIYEGVPNDPQRDVFKVPDFIKKMIENGWLGNKSKQGFYKKEKDENGKKVKLVLDYNTLEYVPKEKFKYDSIAAAKSQEGSGKKLKALVNGEDKAGKFAWRVTRDTLIYSASMLYEIADDIVNIDNAMKWGFNWDLGPFEAWDAIGVKESIERMEAEGIEVPKIIKRVVNNGYGNFYIEANGNKYYYDFKALKYKPVEVPSNVIILKTLKDQNKVIDENGSASLIDLGDGVGLVEFHTKMNAIDDGIVDMLNKGVDYLEEDKLEGLVIGSQGRNFSAGANIMLILMAAQQKAWDQIEAVVKAFQDVNMRMKYAPKPIVAAPYDLTLGGGCEITMHSHRVQADTQTYIGLVEVGVGLLPGGGGNKETYLRAYGDIVIPDDPMKVSQHALQAAGHALGLVAMAQIAMGAKDAIKKGILKPTDNVTLNRDNQIFDAKKTVLAMNMEGFKQKQPLTAIPVAGREGISSLTLFIQGMKYGGYLSDHDLLVTRKIINVLSGGDVLPGTKVSEQYLLDLEREAFVSLCGEPKSQERIQYMLMNNKPLRN